MRGFVKRWLGGVSTLDLWLCKPGWNVTKCRSCTDGSAGEWGRGCMFPVALQTCSRTGQQHLGWIGTQQLPACLLTVVLFISSSWQLVGTLTCVLCTAVDISEGVQTQRRQLYMLALFEVK